jgi:predicted lipoprotein with Yx(FWY)xxD motif
VAPAAVRQAAAGKDSVVSTATTSVGRVLVDGRGRTLYLFGTDRECVLGACAAAWPPLIATAKPRAARDDRARRRAAVTYNHHPVYTFVKDQEGPDQR